MDNTEFETRAFADPDDQQQDFLDALTDNPERQVLLEEVRAFNERIGRIANSLATPPHLSSRLKAAVTDAAGTAAADPARDNVVSLPVRKRPSRLVAAAAALVVAVAMTYTSLFGDNQPSAEEMAFGQQVVDHVYLELNEVNASRGASLQQVNQAMGSVGGSLANDDTIGRLDISFARPCLILPSTRAAHLVVNGERGAINIIIIDNSPVRREFSFSDDRFATVVVPLERGNLILVGEKNESLADLQQMLDSRLTWI